MGNILVLFEVSGAVSIPFRENGHTVTTVDLLPHQKNNENHIQIDVNKLKLNWSSYDMLIAFPPCTYFSKAGLYLLNKEPGRKEKQIKDLQMIKRLWDLPIKYKCFENPTGSALNKLWKKRSCRIDYSEYSDFKKSTDLWLQNLPPLLPEQINKKNYGQFITKMGNSSKRNITPIEVGYAMLKQWGHLLSKNTV